MRPCLPVRGVRARIVHVRAPRARSIAALFTGLMLGLLAGGLSAPDARAEPPAEHWMRVLLDGRKIGQLQLTRTVEDGVVHSARHMELTLQRDGAPLTLRIEERSEDRIDGQPLAFEARLDTAGQQLHLRGRIDGGQWTPAVVQPDGREQALPPRPWPDGALLAEGLRLAAIRNAAAPGRRDTWLAWDATAQQALRVESTSAAAEPIALPDGPRTAIPQDQRIDAGDGPLGARGWIDADGTQLLLRMPMLGATLELQACSRACATADNDATDLLLDTSLDAPRPLSRAQRRGTLDFSLRRTAAHHVPLDGLSAIPGQQVLSADDDRVRLRVSPDGGPTPAPGPEDTLATHWLQSGDPALQAFASAAVADATDDAARMLRLERAVRAHIRDKSLRVGYAGAVETLASREGDCTEHAVLLAALGRSLGIPVRVVSGLAYADRFAGRTRQFVPHAWVMAWVDGRWRGFDAALARFDSAHIGLVWGDGDPTRVSAGLQLLGALQLDAIEPVDDAP